MARAEWRDSDDWWSDGVRRILELWLLLILGGIAVDTPVQAAAPVLRVSDNHRFLVQADGAPFFYLGDTAWELFHRLNREEADTYLQDRADKGFTVIQAVALAELNGLSDPNAYGFLPLVSNDPTKPNVKEGPNNDYWDQVDYVVNKAESLGLFIGFLPTWGTYWHDGVPIFNTTNAQAYGRWLGERYREKPIIWILGGDRNLENAAQITVLRALAQGLRAGDGGVHLITMHPPGGNGSSTWFHSDATVDFNMRQNGHGAEYTGRYDATYADFKLSPPKPVLDGEPIYEDHPISFNASGQGHSVAADARRPLYWDLFGGACGHTYGHHSVWQMYDPAKRAPINGPLMPWYQAIHQPGSEQMQHARRLLESRPFLTRLPDDSVIVTAAVATAVPGAGRYRFAATRDSTGSYALIYAPVGRSFRVQMSKVSGETVKGWWFDPRTGEATAIGLFPNTGQREFTPPDPGELRDWVLVLDDASKNFPPPGQPHPTAAMITTPPASLRVFAGQPASFQVGASGSAPITFQWQRDSVDIPGATNSSYTLTAATASDDGATFRVKVSNPLALEGILSEVASLSVLPETGHKISASFSESGWTTNLGNLAGNGTFVSPDGYPAPSAQVPTGPLAPSDNLGALDFGASASETGGRAIDFTNAFDNTLGLMRGFTIAGWLNCANLDDGAVAHRIAYALSASFDSGFDLTVLNNGALRLGVNQPADFGLASAGSLSQDWNVRVTNWVFFAVTYDGTQTADNLVYYLGSSLQAVVADSTHSYARGQVPGSGPLTVGNFGSSHFARNSTGSSSSAFRGLIDELNIFNRVLALAEIQALQKAPGYQPAVIAPPFLLQAPQNQTVFAGTSVRFGAQVAGTLPLQFQWWQRHNGSEWTLPNEDLQTYVLANPTTTNTGDQFWVVITNAAGSITSPPALLTVFAPNSPKVSLPFSEGSGNFTANRGTLAGEGTIVRHSNSFPTFSTRVPLGSFAPPTNNYSIDFGTIANGEGGRAIDFTNASGGTLGTLSAFTLTGWLNCRDLTAGSGGNRILFALASPGGTGFDLVQNANGSLQLGVNEWPDASPASSTSGKITAEASAGSSNWVFFAVTYDGTKSTANAGFYFGSPTSTAGWDGTVGYHRGPLTISGALSIGNFSTVAGAARNGTGPTDSRNFRGLLDELRVFDRVLTLAEIRSAQTAPATAAPSPRLAITGRGKQVVLTWDSAAPYQLQVRSNLSLGSWTDEPTFPVVNGTFQAVTLPATGATGFYHLINR
jgi:hypothetical protein